MVGRATARMHGAQGCAQAEIWTHRPAPRAAIAAGITNNEDTERLASAALLGTMANVAGTLTMIGGALTGNQTAMNVSFGLLGCSALAGVYVGAKIG